MIDISNKHPWALNSDSICPSFLDVSASDKLNNDEYWRFDFNFEFLNYDENKKIHIISLHPSNLGIFFHRNHLFILLHQNNNGRSIFTQLNVCGKKLVQLTFEHFPHDKIVVTLGDYQKHSIDISSNPLDYTSHRNFYIGSDTHENNDYDDTKILRISEIKISNQKEIIAKYQWGVEDCCDERVKDITGNDNFLFKIK
jgi:hypothetical protein